MARAALFTPLFPCLLLLLLLFPFPWGACNSHPGEDSGCGWGRGARRNASVARSRPAPRRWSGGPYRRISTTLLQQQAPRSIINTATTIAVCRGVDGGKQEGASRLGGGARVEPAPATHPAMSRVRSVRRGVRLMG